MGPSPAPLQTSNGSELAVDNGLNSPPTSGSDGGMTLTPPTHDISAPHTSDSPKSGSSGSTTSPVEIHSPRPTNARERALLAASPTSWEDTSADAGLRDTIKGVYRLWAGSRKQSSSFGTNEKEAFMDVVKDVLADL